MHVIHVHIHVKPEFVGAFIAATIENAKNSIQEPGIARFDFFQQADDPTRFVLNEVYHTPEAPVAHRETPHYLLWRDNVEPMMAEPRNRAQFANLFPSDTEF